MALLYSCSVNACTRSIGIGLTIILLFSPMLSFAQTPSSSLSSSASSSSPSEPVVVIEDRVFRVRSFTGSIAGGMTADAIYFAQRAAYFHTRADNRRTCREDLRRANKTTLMKTLLTCYRNELTSLKDFLGKQKKELQGTAGITPTIRTLAIKKTDLVIDAVGTIIFAIDSGVYGTQEQLLEAKINLYKKYRVPLWDTWMTVRADRTLSWIALLIADIDHLRNQGDRRPELTDTRVCLTFQESSLQHILKLADERGGPQLTTALTGLQDCVKKIQQIVRLPTGTGAILAP